MVYKAPPTDITNGGGDTLQPPPIDENDADANADGGGQEEVDEENMPPPPLEADEDDDSDDDIEITIDKDKIGSILFSDLSVVTYLYFFPRQSHKRFSLRVK